VLLQRNHYYNPEVIFAIDKRACACWLGRPHLFDIIVPHVFFTDFTRFDTQWHKFVETATAWEAVIENVLRIAAVEPWA
jgi:hypothetical protein